MQKKMNVILTLFLVFMVLCSCSKRVMTWQEQYDIGVRYLSEGNYEEAVIAFTAAIDIDPKKVESYIAMSEVYQQQGEYELAYEILERGYHETKSDRLHRVLNAELANKVLKSDATIRETLERLYQCLKEEDVSGIADAFEKWCNLIIESSDSEIEDERNEVAYSDLLFDGERFYAKGEQTDGIPDGTGSLLVTNTIYHDGGVQCYIQRGTWSQGKSIGQAEIVDFASNSHIQTDYSTAIPIKNANIQPHKTMQRYQIKKLDCKLWK